MSRTRARRTVAVVAISGLLCALGAAAVSQAAPSADPTEAVVDCVAPNKPTAGRYIVTMDPTTTSTEVRKASTEADGDGATVRHVYEHAFKGFAGSLTEAALDGLRENPDVISVVRDGIACGRAEERAEAGPGVQTPATWGLDRIDQRALPVNNRFGYLKDGAGVTVYVLDTGLRADHTEFTGRVLPGRNFAEDGHSATNTSDCDGHGTHVSGSIAGTTYGVAKGAKIVPVRVLDCDGFGYWSEIIAGIDWVKAQRDAIVTMPKPPMVANMSLGGDGRSRVDTAVNALISSGVTVVAAAGNESDDACYYSPGGRSNAITVAATNATDQRPGFSNFGTCVDLFAPGTSIVSAGITSTTATQTYSGTSMSTAFTSGAAAAFLEGTTNASPAAVLAGLIGNATANVVGNRGSGSPNLLLFSPGPVGPDLRLTKTVSAPQVVQGGTFTYTLTVTNVGTANAAGISISDMLPPGVTLTGSTGGTCTPATNTTICTPTSPMLTPGTNLQMILTVTAPATGTGPLNNTATASSTSMPADPTMADNTASASTSLVAPPPPASADLAISKTASAVSVPVNGNLTYTVGVQNNGPNAATGVSVVDTLPVGAVFQSASSGCANNVPSTGKVTCSVGSLGVSASVSRTITVKAPPTVGTMTNSATVSATSTDGTPGNNTASVMTNVTTGPTCFGSPATVTGSGSNGRYFRGTNGPDVIIGTSGDDIVDGFGGADKICTGDGRDDVIADEGNDQIDGGAGDDILDGNAGQDTIDGGPGRDDCSGGPDLDSVTNCEVQRSSIGGAEGKRRR